MHFLPISATASSFNPLSIAGMVLWIDATRGVTGTLESAVDQMDDLSGAGNHMVATAPNRPVWNANQFSGKRGVFFPDYETDWLEKSGGVVCADGFSAFCTFKTYGEDATSSIVEGPSMTIIGNKESWYYNSFGLKGGASAANVHYQGWDDGFGWESVSSTGLALNDSDVHTIAVSHALDGTANVYADGVFKATGNIMYNVTNYGFSSVGINYLNNDQALGLWLAEAMIWNTSLTAKNIENLHRRAQNLWIP